MKGIVLAGGTGSRLWPTTMAISKQLIPVYDKPLIHYPLATLMLAGIRDILIITTAEEQSSFIRLLGDGSKLGIHISFMVQTSPNGIAQAFLIGEKFIGASKVALILGDNIFHGSGLGSQLQIHQKVDGANIFAYKVTDPHRYGIIEFGKNGKAVSLEEKPSVPKSSFAVPGLYFYDNEVINITKEIRPSKRGELEITSVNLAYLMRNKLNVQVLERGTAWLDTGTIEALFAANTYVRAIEQRQGMKIGCLEEIAWNQGWITDEQLNSVALGYGESPYGRYLRNLLVS